MDALAMRHSVVPGVGRALVLSVVLLAPSFAAAADSPLLIAA
jgi:hypothetical protein